MKIKISVLITFLLVVTLSFAQKDRVFLTIDDAPVYASEFKRVYNKNLDLVQDASQKTVDGYLGLFIDYKLKVKEARAQGMHTEGSFKDDFRKYQEQLSRNYLYEDRITTDLAKEAFERSLEEVEVSHVLIKVTPDDIAQDTLVAYNKMVEILKKARASDNFTAIAKQYSEEPGAKERGGYLGYFSAFTMVFPFENMAYNTPVGEVSDIVRTSFGYHILKVSDRRKKAASRGVSHIMIAEKSASETLDPKQRIQEIGTLLKQGESFESLAKQFSEDKNSGKRGGSLKPFTKGELRSPAFEKGAFSLTKKGEVSDPIKSEFGWHIIRLDSIHAIPTFEDKKVEFEKRVADGNRNKIVTNAVNNVIKEKFKYTTIHPYLSFFETYTNDLAKDKWTPRDLIAKENKTIFTLDNGSSVSSFKYEDFKNYIVTNQYRMKVFKTKKMMLTTLYERFETETLRKYFADNLEQENAEFAAVVSEYRDGLLIFEVMRKNIWDKAQRDTVALRNYYNENAQNYKWKERVRVQLVSVTTEELAKRVQSLFTNKNNALDIKEELSLDGITSIITRDVLEVSSSKLPNNFSAKKGVSKIYEDEASFVVAMVEEVLPITEKKFEEVKGLVTNDYQNKIEREWLASLRAKYKVEINKKTLKKLRKELDS